MTLTLVKKAIIRDEGYPQGVSAPCHINCECGHRVPVGFADHHFEPSQCVCGMRYDEHGFLAGRPTFRNRLFVIRDYECSNVIACQGKQAPNDNWEPCDESILKGLTPLEIVANVRYFGYL